MGTLASIVGIFVGLGLGVGLFKLFDAVGFTLPNNGLVLAHADGRRRAHRRDPRHRPGEPSPSCARDARADRSQPCAKAPSCRRAGSRGTGRSARRCSRRLGFAALIYGLFGSGLGTKQHPPLHGRRHAPDLHRRRAPRGPVRPPARVGARRAGGQVRRRGRRARPGQRAAEPAADGFDRLGADDRARARDARRRDRGRDHAELPRRGRRSLDQRLRDHCAEQLRSDPDRRRERGRRTRPASRRSRTSAAATRSSSRRCTRRRRSDPGGAQIFNINWLDGGSNAVFARLGAHGAFIGRQLREDAPPDDRLAADADRADRQDRRSARTSASSTRRREARRSGR